jgi:hypothetical protein
MGKKGAAEEGEEVLSGATMQMTQVLIKKNAI